MFNQISSDKDFLWRILLFISLCISILSISNEAFATAATNSDAIGSTLCNVVNNLQGNIAKSISTIAIFVVGAGLFMGKLNWATALATAIGIGIVFGAGKIVNWIGGTGITAACS